MTRTLRSMLIGLAIVTAGGGGVTMRSSALQDACWLDGRRPDRGPTCQPCR